MRTRADKTERVNMLDEYNWDLEILIDKLIELQTENERLLDKIGDMVDRIAELEKG